MEDASSNILHGEDSIEVGASVSLLGGTFGKEEESENSNPKVQVEDTAEESGGVNDNKWYDWTENRTFGSRLPARYRLVTDENARKYSLMSVRYAVLCAAVNTKLLNPNYPIMAAGEDLHDDAFPDTEPFDFNSATYFLPMCSLLGVAISSIFLGQISDRHGRKKVIFILSLISGGGSIAKYFARHTFWGFCIAQFVFGFFLGNLPVAMAYIGDVYTNKKQKQEQLGVIVAYYVVGNSGGGIIAILMESAGLFSALWVGAGLIFLAAFFTFRYMIEPGDARLLPMGKDVLLGEEEEEAERPEEIDQRTMWNVVVGALADNVGSTALFPLCLSPLALEQYTADFLRNDEEPIMTITGYKWLSVMVAGMAVPSTMVTPHIFNKIGVAKTCVLGNLSTAVVTMALLFIGSYAPATTGAFAGFVIVLYGGFPLTVWSQLTTGPMLDVLAPEDKIGYVQGLNNAAMNFGMAIAPWAFGLLADGTTTEVAIWTGIGISVLAALINVPLTYHKEMGPPEKKEPYSKRPLPGEDEELVNRVLEGEFIPPERLYAINRERALNRKPRIVPRVKPYEEDKEDLTGLMKNAEEAFRFRKDMVDHALQEMADPESDRDISEVCEMLNLSFAAEPDLKKQHTDKLGQWIGDYLQDNGYDPHVNSLLMKQMVLTAFPSISSEKEYTPENLEDALLRARQIMNEYLAVHETKKYGLRKILGQGTSPYVAYS